MKIHTYIVEDAGRPLKDGGNNDYSCFSPVQGKKGIYVFQKKETGEVLYVGKSIRVSKGWSLKRRIENHYGRTDTGGNFHINWRRENCHRCSDRKICIEGEECNFEEYENLLRASRVIFLCCEESQGETIYALEKLMIFIFLPEFNDKIMKMRREEMEDVTNLGNIMHRIMSNEPESSTIEGNECMELNSEADSFRNSYVFRIIAASISPGGILADHPILTGEDLDAAKDYLQTLACYGDDG